MRIPHRSRRRRGNAMIEFALMWALLFPVIGGTGQFGNAFYQYNNLCSAVRNATRFASLQTYAAANGTVPNGFRDAVRNVVRYGDPSPGQGAPLITNVRPEHIDVNMTFSNGVPATVSVVVTEFEIDTIFKQYTLHNKPVSQFPYLGRWDPVP